MSAPGSFTSEALSNRRAVREMFEASVRLIEQERFQLHAFIDGYQVTDRGSVIITVRGSQFDLAAKLLRLLREEASK